MTDCVEGKGGGGEGVTVMTGRREGTWWTSPEKSWKRYGNEQEKENSTAI